MLSPQPLQSSPDTNVSSNRLVDSFGRVHDSLRISVTDHCNLRCQYCMPESADDFTDSARLLTCADIVRIVDVLASVGVRKLRITGGEPTLRRELVKLVESLAGVPGIEEIAMTTNGMRLDTLAAPLRQAGLSRINISLDAVTEAAFQTITRRSGLERVLRGIDAALAAGFPQVRLNALAIRDLNEDQIFPLVEFATSRGLTIRFIEYMPLGGGRDWQPQQVLTGSELLARIEARLGPLEVVPRPHASQPAQDYRLANGHGTIGFINPVTAPFCNNCNRLRLTAEGALRNCLFSHEEWSLRELLSTGADNEQLLTEIRACVGAKKAGHLIARPAFRQPERPMYRIGG